MGEPPRPAPRRARRRHHRSFEACARAPPEHPLRWGTSTPRAMGALAPGAARERRASMTRAQLEHVIRAAADIADDDEIVIIGRQSILGAHPNAPAALLVSAEADVYPKNRPERWDLIDGSIGEGSPFHETFGYYAQGVEEGTATLSPGWKDRVILVCNSGTRFAKGWCLEPDDLLLAKLAAGRAK